MRYNSTREFEFGDVFFQLLPYPFGNVDQVDEAGGAFPGFVVLPEEEEVALDRGEFLVDKSAANQLNEVQSMRRASLRGRWT